MGWVIVYSVLIGVLYQRIVSSCFALVSVEARHGFIASSGRVLVYKSLVFDVGFGCALLRGFTVEVFSSRWVRVKVVLEEIITVRCYDGSSIVEFGKRGSKMVKVQGGVGGF